MADRRVDYLLIGGGLASGNCARWLRESGADGTILIVGREPDDVYRAGSWTNEVPSDLGRGVGGVGGWP